MNYGDYAYIEAFPRRNVPVLPGPERRRAAPRSSRSGSGPSCRTTPTWRSASRIHELDKLVANGLSEEDFQTTRDYLMKNVFLMTATQDQQLGYALDSEVVRHCGEYAADMRDKLAKLTRADVNAADQASTSQAKDLSVVIVTKDADGLKEKLVADEFSPITYDGEKPKALLDEDKVIGALQARHQGRGRDDHARGRRLREVDPVLSGYDRAAGDRRPLCIGGQG